MQTTEAPTRSRIACRSACWAAAGRPSRRERTRAPQVRRRITIGLPTRSRKLYLRRTGNQRRIPAVPPRGPAPTLQRRNGILLFPVFRFLLPSSHAARRDLRHPGRRPQFPDGTEQGAPALPREAVAAVSIGNPLAP